MSLRSSSNKSSTSYCYSSEDGLGSQAWSADGASILHEERGFCSEQDRGLECSSESAYHLIASSSILSENPYGPCFSSVSNDEIAHLSYHLESSNESWDNERQLSDSEIQLKIQELEHALLDDTDEQQPVAPEQVMDEGEAPTPKRMLFDCAAAISEGRTEEAKAAIQQLRQAVSIRGDPPQRLAAYLVEGLAARMASSGGGIYNALRCKEPPASDRLSAMQILFEICPCFKFGFMAANYAMVEAFRGEEQVHIIDFDINQGSQYITLVQLLSSRFPSPPRVRITGVDDPESVQRSVGGLRVIGMRLAKLAEDLQVPFEFRAVAARTADVTPEMLGCRPGEALVVNFAFQLHHLPDESVSVLNQRDQLLRMVKGLRPKLVTLVEQDVNTNTAPFFPRFVEVYNYYSAVFESLDAALPRESPDRMNVEQHCLARDIVNIVACEGTDRIERYEAAGKWRARMTMAGFALCPFNAEANASIRALLRAYCDMYMAKEENGALSFGWRDKTLVLASAWR